MKFYLGTHMVNHAQEFKHTFISANRLWTRKSHFKVNNWIMDSGAFTEVSKFGKFRHSVEEYAGLINRFKGCGNFECAVTQDMMCEPFILDKTGLSVKDHQRLTTERYSQLRWLAFVYVMPVLQGYEKQDYLNHLDMYGNLITTGGRVGVGSVCKRNRNTGEIEGILKAIKDKRPDLKLHGFGLKITALRNDMIRSLLYSADSMAWAFHAWKNGGNSNGLEEAQAFNNQINTMPIQGNIWVTP
jgi:hypothetical protein